MEKLLKEYEEAVQESIELSRQEVMIKDKGRKAHYRLLKASEELRAKTNELLEDTLILN